MKPVRFRGNSRQALKAFPDDAREEAGQQLYYVQNGQAPDDWKPMPTIGRGVREIRLREESGAY